MPIGDLLASISGSQPAASSSSQPKRKAEDELKPAPKVARKDPPSKPTLASRPLDRPNAVPRSTNGAKPGDKALKPLNSTHKVTKPVASARPSPTTPSNGASAAVKSVPPKRGSYAEVLARAKKAQESMGQVGRIQHKKSEKKEKEVAQKPSGPGTPGKKSAGATRSTGYQGTGKANARSGTNGTGMKNGGTAKDERGRAMGKPMSERDRKAAKAAEVEQEKKMKKAAAATTGYTGTARPKPGANTKKKEQASRGGALLNSAPPRHSGPRRSSYEDDYDEDMDDFIDYDDEEDDQAGGPRYHYDSEGSSDMEAGIDDLEGEERRAETIARREDIEEERLEKSLKAAKEERKRKALDALRAKRR